LEWNYSLLIRADARGSADTITACDAYRYFAGRALLMTPQSRSRTEYLLQTACIIVLDSYFNFTKKSNLVGNLYNDFLNNWWWLTFLGHPVGIHVGDSCGAIAAIYIDWLQMEVSE